MTGLRLVVTGRDGQVARSLREAASAACIEVIPVGRPDLRLEDPASIAPAIIAARPDVVVSAAAYTAVDRAEQEAELAMAMNGAGAGAVAAAAKSLGVPVIQLSTDYVFDGSKTSPYVEDDLVGPIGSYGASKLAGEQAVAAETSDYAILRTAWVYAPFGKNFVITMLKLAETRDQLRVVADQRGCPTYAPDIAAAVIAVARNLLDRPFDAALRGVFHMSGAGETDWASFAEEIFALSSLNGDGRRPQVARISTAEYPTPAKRPANSRLDCTKLAETHGVQLPPWRASLEACIARLGANETIKN